MNRFYTLFLLLLFTGLSFHSNAQSDVTLQNCIKYLEPEFISDGQQY